MHGMMPDGWFYYTCFLGKHKRLKVFMFEGEPRLVQQISIKKRGIWAPYLAMSSGDAFPTELAMFQALEKQGKAMDKVREAQEVYGWARSNSDRYIADKLLEEALKLAQE